MKLTRLLLLALVFVVIGVDSGIAQWEKAAGPEGATVTSMVKLGGAIYITAGNTVYKSTDGGATWMNKRNGIPEIASLSVIGANDDVLVVGANDSGNDDKVFVSTDGGDNWTATGGLGAIILAGDWASKDSTLFMMSNFGKLYRSNDDGATFTDLGAIGAGSVVHVIGDTVYVSGRGFIRRSTDMGDTFSENIGTGGGVTFGFLQINTATWFNGSFIIGTSAGTYMLDGSDMWVASSTGFPTNILAQPNVNVTQLLVIGNNLWAITTNGIYFTTDISTGWTLAPNGPAGVEGLNGMADGNAMYFGTSGAGIYRADDATSSDVTPAAMNSGLIHATINGFTADGSDLVVFGKGFGILKTADAGNTFTPFNGDLPARNVTDVVKIGSRYLAALPGGLYASPDGAIWTKIDTAPVGLTILSTNGTIVLAGVGTQIYKSTDNGDTWTAVSNPNQFSTAQPRTFAYNGDVILAGLTGGGIARSADAGETWNQIGSAAGLGSVVERNQAVIFVGDDAFVTFEPLFGNGGIRKSTDMGLTWTDASTGLPSAFGSIVPTFRLVNAGESILTSTNEGVYSSSDGGANWTALNNMGLPATKIGPLFSFDGYFFMGTDGESMFRTGGVQVSTEGDGSDAIPSTIALDQNYPNPFNPTTNISFTLPQAGDVSLKVYNVLGQEVATVINQRMSAGTFTATFNASGLSSGVYLYRLVANGSALVRRMTLIK